MKKGYAKSLNDLNDMLIGFLKLKKEKELWYIKNLKELILLQQDIRIFNSLKQKKMETVKSYLQIHQDENLTWNATVINEQVTVPSNAKRVTDTFKFEDGHIYNFYHMPDSRWYTDESG